ncbi:dienelactone hydrolase [Solitalea longa]|uniref:Dienelactone hydrolase n=1 Tax=Solitalea longa TaxID=2079460 RepID=A0A2S4ZXI2_9SPHI|nr:dienelactone hydrolase family protein [Solitalea longa]POY35070.1 dienelactone hydrolase [Solitalea longa]
MKKLFLLTLTLLPALGFTQSKMSCCQVSSASSTEEFAQFSTDREFVQSHLDPIPFEYKSEIGRDVMIPAADGKEAHIYEFKAAKPTNNYIFVIHEWYGLNNYIKQESEKLYHALGNVNVIALDLYDKQVATNRDEASKYMQSVTEERAHSIINAAIKYAGTKAKIVTIGWCFGGGWSMQTSLLAGPQAAGCIMYYGMPEKDEAKLKTLKADVLGIFAEKDKWITPQVVKEFEENMQKAGKKLTVKSYNADHAFANPSNPLYDKESTADAYEISLAFLKARLK